MSQVQACSALSMAESAAHSGGAYTWDSLDQALAEGRIIAGSIDAQDFHGTTAHGTTALHIAAEAGRTSTVRALVAAGATLNVRKIFGWSPLTGACREGLRQAGGIVRYEKMRRAPFITALTRCGGFPIPSDTIPLVVEFWVRRALEY